MAKDGLTSKSHAMTDLEKTLMRPRTFNPSIFDDFFKPWNEWFSDRKGLVATVPAVNVTETDGNYQVMLAVPGLKKDDFHIDVDGNLVTISAETKAETEEKGAQFTRKEYNYSSFSRTFTLPENIDREKIEARYENGELKLVLPKKGNVPTADKQQIKIN
jgi:HSP20 family protein